MVREQPWKHPIPVKWHVLRVIVLIGSIAILLFAFSASKKSQPKLVEPSTVTNIQQPTTPVIPNDVKEIIDDIAEGD